MKKIIILLVLCVSCGKNEMSEQVATQSSALKSVEITISQKDKLCVEKCESSYGPKGWCYSNLNIYLPSSEMYKGEIKHCKDMLNSCYSHCSSCSAGNWSETISSDVLTLIGTDCHTPRGAEAYCDYSYSLKSIKCSSEDY